MKDPFNATREEIKDWAYNLDDDTHEQDWDIVSVAHTENIDLLVALVIDEKCPRRLWALHMLYFISGNKIDNQPHQQIILEMMNSLEKNPHPDIQLWIARTRDLYTYPEKFERKAWKHGCLVRGDARYVLEE